MMGYEIVRQIKRFNDLADAHFAFAQEANNLQAVFFGDGFEQFGDMFKFFFSAEAFGLYIHSVILTRAP